MRSEELIELAISNEQLSITQACLVLVSVDRKVKDVKTIYRRISSDRSVRNRFRQVEIGLGGISSLRDNRDIDSSQMDDKVWLRTFT